MNRTIILIGIFLGGLAIILGAFGAHGLEKIVDARSVDTFEVGVRYQMYHALFLLFLGGVPNLSDPFKKRILVLICVGLILFSGSIYLLSLKELISPNLGRIGFLTPIGGIFLISGWGYAGYVLLAKKGLN